MPEPNFRRAVLRYSLGKKPVFTGFLVRAPKIGKFIALKKRYQGHLMKCMQFPGRHDASVPQMLRSCLIKLNRLPFVYTKDSNRPLYGSSSQPAFFEYSRSLPKGKKYFFYRAPFISIQVDGSKRSFQFWKKTAELCKKYPKACLSPLVPCTSFEVMPSIGKLDELEFISRKRLNSKLAEARRFFREVEGIAGEFLGK